jgi:uncharacterized protein (TIGR03435 family)
MKPILLAAFCAGLALAQTPAPLQFEVASVRPSAASGPNAVTVGLHLDGAQVRITTLTMRDYIAMAYRVRQYQVEGPDWITSEKFDLSAKLPAGSNSDQIPEMVAALLSDRFNLKFHRASKELPIYALIVGKPPLNLHESAPDAAGADARPATNITAAGSEAGVSVDLGRGSYYTFSNNKFEIRTVNTDMLVRVLERYVDRPLIDQTGLKGTYDFDLPVTPEDYQTMLIRAAVNSGVVLPPQALQLLDNGSIASLTDGLEKAGLKMDARKAPLDMIVIDQISKTPTDN